MARIGGSCGLQPRWRSCSARSVPPPRRSLCCGREQLAHNGSLSLDSFRARRMRMMAEFSHIRESPPLPETREPDVTFQARAASGTCRSSVNLKAAWKARGGACNPKTYRLLEVGAVRSSSELPNHPRELL